MNLQVSEAFCLSMFFRWTDWFIMAKKCFYEAWPPFNPEVKTLGSLLFWWALARSNFWYTDWLPESGPHNNGRHVSNMFKRDGSWHILVSCSAILRSDNFDYVPYLYSPWSEWTVHWTAFIECVHLQSRIGCKSNLRSCLKTSIEERRKK